MTRTVHFPLMRKPGRTVAVDIAQHSAQYAGATPGVSGVPTRAQPGSAVERAVPGSVTDETDLAIHAFEFVRLRYEDSCPVPKPQRVLERCIRFLMALGNISQQRAEILAAQALGEYESGRAGVTFDMDRSTSYVVFLHDPNTCALRAVTAAQLLTLLDSAA